ncbi:497_t:CDS:2 [Racocetra fulgida]|uniref:497_t:CDS:1 n=1 Tax=Racocetra fulgida TaxID=60492 RepID=A0A9N8Z2L0_9GLOM|nr:497_t:CDS:2 [Racocetra fulgida]
MSDNKKKKQTNNTNIYLKQINNESASLPPTISPFKLQAARKKKQQKVDTDWAEVYSRIIQFETLYNYFKDKTFKWEDDKNKEINKQIKLSIPNGMSTKMTRWRKVYDLIAFIKVKDIDIDAFLNEITI